MMLKPYLLLLSIWLAVNRRPDGYKCTTIYTQGINYT